MKAYNSRKTPREIYLFRKKFRKLSLSYQQIYTGFNGERKTCVITGVFKVKQNKGSYLIFGDSFKMRSCFRIINKIVNNTSNTLSITQTIKYLEEGYNIKISELGITRKEFFQKDNVINIGMKIREYILNRDKKIKGVEK